MMRIQTIILRRHQVRLELAAVKTHARIYERGSSKDNTAEKRTLEMIADGASLGDVLDQLCGVIDAQVAPSVTTILLMDADGECLRHGAGRESRNGFRR
jgi:hypothetical protein